MAVTSGDEELSRVEADDWAVEIGRMAASAQRSTAKLGSGPSSRSGAEAVGSSKRIGDCGSVSECGGL